MEEKETVKKCAAMGEVEESAEKREENVLLRNLWLWCDGVEGEGEVVWDGE